MRGQLRREEWLHIARGLAVGESRRVPHKGDHSKRANLLVSNHADHWAAYCFACKTGARLAKTHVRYQPKAPKASTLLTHPHDATLLTALPQYKQNMLAGFLARKGMDLLMLPPGLAFSETRQRLLVPTDWGLLGRDVTGDSHQKWLTYDRSSYLGTAPPGRTLVLVEDAFSYFKVQWCLRHYQMGDMYCAVCTLGTSPGVRCVRRLLELQPDRILVMYDGDDAGASGASAVQRRMRALGVRTSIQLATWGMDPKDMQADDIKCNITEAKWM